MSLISKVRSLYRQLFRDAEVQKELDTEVAAYFEEVADRNMAQGMSREEAQRAARLKFEGPEQVKQRVLEAQISSVIDTTLRDARFAGRMLRKSAGFTTVVVLTLALAIGANTAIFSLINAVALRLLSVPNPQELVLLEWTARHEPDSHLFARFGGCPSGRGDSTSLATACSFSYPMFEQVRSMRDIFSGVFAYSSAAVALRVDNHLRRGRGMYVSGEFFSTLEATTSTGRAINVEDDRVGAEPIIVLSYRYWQNDLGGDPTILGKVATVNLKPLRIVGITGRGFPDLDPGVPMDFWMPLAAKSIVETHPPSQTDEKAFWVYVLATLRHGVQTRQAEAELNAVFVPSTTVGPGAVFKPEDRPHVALSSAAEGMSSLRSQYKRPLFILMTAVGLILLLGCANVAGLMLARSSARQKEMALRSALGAPRLRIVRQVLTESLMLSAAGGAIAIVFAELAAKALVAFLSANSFFPLQIDVGIDWHILGFTVAVSTLVGILFGLAPALRVSRVDVAPTLQLGGGTAATQGPPSVRLGNLLVAMQVAISILVLVGAGLLGRTLLNLERVDTGFETRNLLIYDVDMTASGLKLDDPQCDKLNHELQNRFAALPGVKSASYSNMPLLTGGSFGSEFSLPATLPSAAQSAELLPVGQGFFETMGIPLIAGRTFTRADFESSPPLRPIVVNQAFARKLFGNDSPLGHIVIEGSGADSAKEQIIGVVGDTKYASIRNEVLPMVFTTHLYRITSFELRTEGDPKAIVSFVRKATSEVNPDYLILRMSTQQQEIDRTIYQERLVAGLFVLFGLLALALACVGLYGLSAYGVARRIHEIGIRMALGARPRDVMWLTVKLGLALTLAGVVIGIGVAAGVTRYLQSLLYHVRPTDPWIFAGIASLLVGAAAAGCYIPARQATRIDPMTALRHE